MASAYVALLSLNFSIEQNQGTNLNLESLKIVSAFLLQFFEDYHDSKVSSEKILSLEMRTKDVALELSCLFDSIAMDNMLRKHGRNDSSQLFSQADVDRMKEELKSIEEEATSVIKDIQGKKCTAGASARDHNGTKFVDSIKAKESQTRQAPSPAVENNSTTCMVGFEHHLVAVMEQIAGHASTLQILPIVGMGGIGKTTLAQGVYDKQFIKEHFQIRLWATVSQLCNVHDILLSFLVELKIVGHHFQGDIQELGVKLYKHLFGRRYLIVMDDIWDRDTEVWDEIRRFFPDNNNGSRIILTTRLLAVASHMGSCHPYELNYLNQKESWNLLEAKVFGKNRCPSTLEDVGRRIAASCEGLPLAIVVIAGQLAKSDMTYESWENVARSLISILHSENDSQCLKILSLSYDNLPIHLRTCFLYMGFKKKGLLFEASRLIKFWIADGIVKPISGKCLEDTAMQYLTDLVERNLISVIKRGSAGKVKSFSIHDLLHDLCVMKSDEHKFLYKGVNNRTLGMHDCPHKVPLSKFSGRVCYEELSSANMWFHQCADHNLRNFRLRHIRLSLSQATETCSFSTSLAKIPMFHYLETLQIDETLSNDDPIVLPPGIWEMPLIRHVCISQVVLPDPPTNETSIKESCILGNLQTLQDVHCFKLTEEVLRRIPNLKKLKMTYTKESNSSVEWKHYCLHNLAQLCKLESLSLSVCEMIPPADISFPRSLRKLTLDGCKLPWEEITIVGSLPNLEVLRLQNDAFLGREWKPVEGEFCHLKVLHLRNMSLQKWEADRSHFPRLERLVIYNAWRLKEIPADIGDIETLQFISIGCCRKSLQSSVEHLIEEQESMGNIGIHADYTWNSIRLGEQSISSEMKIRRQPNIVVENFGDELRELYAFLRYAARKQGYETLNELSKQIRNTIYEYIDVAIAVDTQWSRSRCINNYTFRWYLSVVKEVEYVSVRVQRVLLADCEGYHDQELTLYKDPPSIILMNNGDEAHSSRMRRLAYRHWKGHGPYCLKGYTEYAEYAEPPMSNSMAHNMFNDCALFTSIDGLSNETEIDCFVHYGIQCDYCEIYPIVGVRYKCKVCREGSSFDLCEECYSSGLVSDHPGLDKNNKHTSEHEFEILTLN